MQKLKKYLKLWGIMLNRGGNFKITMSTKVCSNHSVAGYCSDMCRVPSLYMKGYQVEAKGKISPRKRSRDHQISETTVKRSKHLHRTSEKCLYDSSMLLTPAPNDHNYEVCGDHPNSKGLPYDSCSNCTKTRQYSLSLFNKCTGQEVLIAEL